MSPKRSSRRPSASRPGPLAAAGADAIVIETMSDLDRGADRVQAAQDHRAARGREHGVRLRQEAKDRTMMGATPGTGRRRARGRRARTRSGPTAAWAWRGIFRLRPAEEGHVLPRLDQAERRAARDRRRHGPLPHDARPSSPPASPELLAAGADFIGGCCGTDPAFIAGR